VRVTFRPIDHATPMLAILMQFTPRERRLIGRFAENMRMDHNGCAVWQGELVDKGYPRFFDGERNVMAHRWLYELLVGPIPDGSQLHHACRNAACVNPEHLRPVTAAEHNAITHPRRTHCPAGHPYDEVNTRWYQGRRYCRTCNNNGRRPVRRSRLPELHAERRQAPTTHPDHGGDAKDFADVQAAREAT
jgi:hypothetical protein